MSKNPLQQLEMLGQSIWLDYIKRDLFEGKLQKMILGDSLRGMTSNPTIFEKSITEGDDYDAEINALARSGKKVTEIYEALTQKDVSTAADQFRALYDKTGGQDGYVSLEVNPHLAHDTEGTINEARRFWHGVNRPNILIKVPATKAGLPAIKQLISEGISVNVTLLFGTDRYREVVEAYLAGLEARAKQGLPVNQIASVASFFLSRIDVLLDPIFEEEIAKKTAHASIAQQLHGQVAINSAKNAYGIFEEQFNSSRFRSLQQQGAKIQRLLWASTGTKNPNYSDIKYVEALIGPKTVNTLPLETLEAYRDHGKPVLRLLTHLSEAKACFSQLPSLGISLLQVTQQLEDEGVEKFIKSYDLLIAALEKTVGK